MPGSRPGNRSSRTASSWPPPGLSTVYQWRAAQNEFADLYARAREDQADALANRDARHRRQFEPNPNDRRIRIDTRKWISAKLKPRTYGDKVQTEVSGDPKLIELVMASYNKAQQAEAGK